MTTDYNCKNVTINVCGCYGQDNAGSEDGAGLANIGQWKLLGTLGNTVNVINLNEVNYSEIMCVAFAGYWQTGICGKTILEMINASTEPTYIMPTITTAATYESTFVIFELENMKIKIQQISQRYDLNSTPVYIY